MATLYQFLIVNFEQRPKQCGMHFVWLDHCRVYHACFSAHTHTGGEQCLGGDQPASSAEPTKVRSVPVSLKDHIKVLFTASQC